MIKFFFGGDLLLHFQIFPKKFSRGVGFSGPWGWGVQNLCRGVGGAPQKNLVWEAWGGLYYINFLPGGDGFSPGWGVPSSSAFLFFLEDLRIML